MWVYKFLKTVTLNLFFIERAKENEFEKIFLIKHTDDKFLRVEGL